MILDKPVCKWVHKSVRTGGRLEYLMAIFAATFNNEIVGFLYSFFFLFLPWTSKTFLMILLIPGVTLVVVLVLKKVISRERPLPYFPRTEALIFNFRGQERNKSMPSGDSA